LLLHHAPIPQTMAEDSDSEHEGSLKLQQALDACEGKQRQRL